MSVGAARRADRGAPTPAGLDALAEALRRYPHIRVRRQDAFLHLLRPAPSRCIVVDRDTGTYKWYSGAEHGVLLSPDPVEAAKQVGVVVGGP